MNFSTSFNLPVPLFHSCQNKVNYCKGTTQNYDSMRSFGIASFPGILALEKVAQI